MHWVCGAINIKDKRFEYYDSLSSTPNNHAFAVSFLDNGFSQLVHRLSATGYARVHPKGAHGQEEEAD